MSDAYIAPHPSNGRFGPVAAAYIDAGPNAVARLAEWSSLLLRIATIPKTECQLLGGRQRHVRFVPEADISI